MVYGFAKQSGGDLKIESQSGEYTIVSLSIPEAQPDESPNVVGDAPRAGISQIERALIVEDQPHVRDVLCRLLEGLNIEAVGVDSGDAALEMLQRSELPDLLISDILMPGKTDGQELARWVRETHPQIPVVLVSGYTESIENEVSFLAKPFTFEELEKAISEAVVAIKHSRQSEV